MLIEVSSRICFYHVAKCFQDDSQIQDQMLQHLQLQQYLPIITNESEHIFINPQAKEPTQCKKLLIFG